MKIYKRHFVSRESYFVRIGKAFSRKNEASKSKGYAIDFIDGKWHVTEASYYDCHLRDMPIVVENKVSILKDTPYCNAVYIPKRSQQIKSKRLRAKKRKRR